MLLDAVVLDDDVYVHGGNEGCESDKYQRYFSVEGQLFLVVETFHDDGNTRGWE